jgi:cytochrome c-type biogenesis protein
VTGSPVELGFAFSLGTATFFAPCALPLLPGYVAYFLGQDGESRDSLGGRVWSGLVVAAITSLGLLSVFGVLAAVAVLVGERVLRNVAVLELVAGVVLVVLGAGMLTGRLSGLSVRVRLPERRAGPVGYFSFGVVYAAAAAGCTGPLFIGLVSLALANPLSAVSLLSAYAAGMVSLLVAVTLATALGREALVRRVTASGERVTRFAGGVLVLAGIVQLYFFFVVFDGVQGLAL